MLKYLTNAISRLLGFSKVESRGTLALIFLMIFIIALTQFYTYTLKSKSSLPPKEQQKLLAWVQEINNSIELKSKAENIDRNDYLPVEKIDKKNSESIYPTEKSSEQDKIMVGDINIASPTDLQKVKGIGPSYSNRIVKFRAKLGGFVNMDQLHEVYGLDSITVKEISNHFSIQSPVTPLDINSDSVKTLIKHQAWLDKLS